MSKIITIEAFWKGDPGSYFQATCQIGLDIPDNDDDIFYYFEENEPILGEHDDFIVMSYE